MDLRGLPRPSVPMMADEQLQVVAGNPNCAAEPVNPQVSTIDCPAYVLG